MCCTRLLEAWAAHREPVTCMGLSPCGRVLVVGSMDHTSSVWQLPPAAMGRDGAAGGSAGVEGAGADARARLGAGAGLRLTQPPFVFASEEADHQDANGVSGGTMSASAAALLMGPMQYLRGHREPIAAVAVRSRSS